LGDGRPELKLVVSGTTLTFVDTANKTSVLIDLDALGPTMG
jgi:hypothetical protein